MSAFPRGRSASRILPAPNPRALPQSPSNFRPGACAPGLFASARQLTPVIVHPQRGQSAPVPERQVVPQFEQVQAEARVAHPQFREGAALPQGTLPPVAEVATAPFAPLSHTFSNAQDDCGNSGRLKNSSHTFSANSSAGGMSQKPYVGIMMSTSASTFKTTVTQTVISKVQFPM